MGQQSQFNLNFYYCLAISSEFLSRLQGVSDIDCLSCRGGDGNYIQSQAFGGLSQPAYVSGAPRSKELHLPCNPFKELCHCPGQALGLCSESVPTGKPSAYGTRFALGNTFTTQPFGLTQTMYHCSLQVYRLCGLTIVIGAVVVIATISIVKPWED